MSNRRNGTNVLWNPLARLLLVLCASACSDSGGSDPVVNRDPSDSGTSRTTDADPAGLDGGLDPNEPNDGGGPTDSGGEVPRRGSGRFSGATEYLLGSGSHRLAELVDVDGDGWKDVIAFDSALDRVVFVPGRPELQFGRARPVIQGLDGLRWGRARRIDGDETIDLAVLQQQATEAKIVFFSGLGDGNFVRESELALPTSAGTFNMVDVNEDGRQDIVYWDRYLQIYWGGDGFDYVDSYAFQSEYEAFHVLYENNVGDCNGDGFKDFIVGQSLMLGGPDEEGNWNVVLEKVLRIDADEAALIDLRGDSRDEMVMVGDSQVTILSCDREDAQRPPSIEFAYSGSVNSNYRRPEKLDTRGDGGSDLLVWNSGLKRLEIFSLEAPDSISILEYFFVESTSVMESLRVDDADKDGLVEIIFQSPQTLVVFDNSESGFETAIPTSPREPFRLGSREFLSIGGAADFDGDMKLDVFAFKESELAFVFKGLGDGSFDPEGVEVFSGNVSVTRDAAIADFDANGEPDIVAVGFPYKVVVATNGSDGDFTISLDLEYDFSEPEPINVASTDIDSDGNADIVIDRRSIVSILLGKGDGTFSESEDFEWRVGRFFFVEDIDQDGRDEVIRADEDFVEVRRWDDALAGLGPATRTEIDDDLSVAGAAIADADGDSIADLVYLAQRNQQMYLVSYLGKRDDTFDVLGIESDDLGPALLLGGSRMKIVDVDGDSAVDIVVASTETISVCFGRGDGTFAPPAESYEFYTSDRTSSGSSKIVVGDANNDGLLDFLGTRETRPGLMTLLQEP